MFISDSAELAFNVGVIAASLGAGRQAAVTPTQCTNSDMPAVSIAYDPRQTLRSVTGVLMINQTVNVALSVVEIRQCGSPCSLYRAGGGGRWQVF